MYSMKYFIYVLGFEANINVNLLSLTFSGIFSGSILNTRYASFPFLTHRDGTIITSGKLFRAHLKFAFHRLGFSLCGSYLPKMN